MKKVDDLQIGEKFRLGDREFVIEEEKEVDIEACVGCFFKDANLECRELQIFSIIPECSFTSRKDKKDVIFKEVTND